jgi:hypothetical protein
MSIWELKLRVIDSAQGLSGTLQLKRRWQDQDTQYADGSTSNLKNGPLIRRGYMLFHRMRKKSSVQQRRKE